MSDPYRGTVESDVEATKRSEAAQARWDRMSPLDRARVAYECAAISNTPTDPEERRKALEAFRRLRDEYYRLLDARNGGR